MPSAAMMQLCCSFLERVCLFLFVYLPSLSLCPKGWSVNMSLHIRAACTAWKAIPAFTQTDICMRTHNVRHLEKNKNKNHCCL